MRPRSAAALAALLALSSAGCAGAGGDAGGPTAAGRPVASSSPSPAPQPRTPADFLARAREAMSAQRGWTFTVRGSEGLTSPGGRSSATYRATVDRTQEPSALHSTGSTRAKGATKPEEVYVVGGTGYVKKGGARWKSGPLTDPEIANTVEDPIAALEAFGDHDGVSVRRTSDGVELRVTAGPAALTDVRDRAVVKKAVRELTPTLEQLRSAGIAVSESRVTLERVEEVLTLDPTTYRLTSHRFHCAFLIPSSGGSLRYGQEVTERTKGVFTGTIALPAGVS